MVKVILFVCTTVTLVLLAATVYAQTQQAVSLSAFYRTPLEPELNSLLENMNEEESEDSDFWSDKMVLGVINTITSWTEIPKGVLAVSGEQNLVAGFTLGFGKGVVSGLARGASGVFDMTTFGIPPYNKPVMLPEYKLKNPEQGLEIALFSF